MTPVPEDDPAEDRWAANRADALVAICDNVLARAPEELGSSPATREGKKQDPSGDSLPDYGFHRE